MSWHCHRPPLAGNGSVSSPRKGGGEAERTGGIQPGARGLGRLPPFLSLWACAAEMGVGGEAWKMGRSSGQRAWLHSLSLSVTRHNGVHVPLDVSALGGHMGLVYP